MRLAMEDQTENFLNYLDSLFNRAFAASSFDTLCAVLRVGGWTGQDWDPFEESQLAFEDLKWLFEKACSERSSLAAARVAILAYCQAVEMTAPHVLLANLLRIAGDRPYVINPFATLVRRKKRDFLSYVPPSATSKFRHIKSLAESIGESRLTAILDSFFDERVRNAFSHSDYILTDKSFRWTEGGAASQIALDELYEKINLCFAFYRAILDCAPRWRHVFGTLKRYHKFPRFEVLELLKDIEGSVYGFQMHFSNGAKASYARTHEGSRPVNVRPSNDGSISFFVGSIDDLESVWKVDGKPVEDWSAINRG
jgi:hypothetical protein